MEATKEYFNLYVEFHKMEYAKDDLFDTIAYPLLNEEELKQYIDLVKKKSWGEYSIGNYNLVVNRPRTIKIFDTSKVKGEKVNREELLKMVPLSPAAEISLLEQLENYGVDVTQKLFGEELELFINNLQLEIQLEQRGINAQTGETGSFFSEGNMKGNVKGGSSVEGDLGDKASRIYPKEFQEGILDGSVEPAFNVERIASVFANHLKNLKHENGQMIGVFGQWGRGKSYFVRQVYEQLEKISEDEPPFVNVQFQAWKYQSTPTIWAYLFETFIKEYLDVNWWNRIWRTVHLSVVRKGKWKTWGKSVTILILGLIGVVFIPSILNLFPNIQDAEIYQNVLQIVGGTGIVAFLITKLNSFIKFAQKPALQLFNSLSKIPSFEHVLGIQEEIHKELISLIKAWKKYLGDQRLLLFIDDLDRCSHESLIEIVDSLRVMLDDEEINKHVLVLMAVDEDKLQRVIRTKYEKLFKDNGSLHTISVEYLDKLFISAIKLYPISDNERAEFIRKIARQINPEEIKNTQSGEELKKNDTGSEETETDLEIHNGVVSSEGVVDSDQDVENEDDIEIIPVMADFKSESGQQQNLDKTEITALSEKIKLANKEITPRQIRIVVYRYLLARNLWLAFYGNLDWETDDAISEIMRLSGFTKEDPKAQTKVNGGLFKICEMVVAY
ncbi:P-loop NTPase fold protein [uncultured Draconibacterium sp.]|uniref:P-loop NTPase fold protein n=1 Tax=uncultured Draconibacterium sp. TaxID=1573823 RepID=UPI0032164E06